MHISADYEGLDNGITGRNPIPPASEGGFDIGAEQDLLSTIEPSTFNSVGSPTRSLHGSSETPHSPTGQENHHYIGRDKSELDEEEQQEKEDDNANIPGGDCIDTKCNEVNGSLRQAEQRRQSARSVEQISDARDDLISRKASHAACYTTDKVDSEGVPCEDIMAKKLNMSVSGSKRQSGMLTEGSRYPKRQRVFTAQTSPRQSSTPPLTSEDGNGSEDDEDDVDNANYEQLEEWEVEEVIDARIDRRGRGQPSSSEVHRQVGWLRRAHRRACRLP